MLDSDPSRSSLLADQAGEDLPSGPGHDIVAAVEEMVTHPAYPCLGARSVFRRNAATLLVLEDMHSAESLAHLSGALTAFERSSDPTGPFVSLVAAFRAPAIRSEQDFEGHLWAVLQHLHDFDDRPWAAGVADDPARAHFAFSHGGVPFFIVGLHPKASRIARRTSVPVLVFNLHEQFERLRSEGSYDRMRDKIRQRDQALQGSINPMVDDHGRSSEARQYSGRKVDDGWHAPFEARDE
jgi:FPC/CPF motif-containing protein YcgG